MDLSLFVFFVTHSPEKASKGKEIAKVHRRHPVHKKGINGELKVKKEAKVKKIKEDPDKIRTKRKRDKREGKRKKHRHSSESSDSKVHKSMLSKEERKQRKKLKKEKKRKHSKDKYQDCSVDKIRKIGSKSPVIKVKHVCDLSQLAEAAERVAANSGMFIPSGSNVGSSDIKVEVTAGGDAVPHHRTETAVVSNGQANNESQLGTNIESENFEKEHTYSSPSATSKRKKANPTISSSSISCNNNLSSSSTNDSIEKKEENVTQTDSKVTVEEAPGESPSKEVQKITERG